MNLGMGHYPLADLAQLLFFVFALVMFKRYPRALAAAIVVIGGTLFLPETLLFRMPGLPYIDKSRVIYMAAFLGLFAYHRNEFGQRNSGFGPELFIVLMFLSAIGTLSMNTNPMVNNGTVQHGLSLMWLISRVIDDFFMCILPFMIGRLAFRDLEDLKVLAYVMVGAGVIYAGMIAIEVIMSIPWRVFRWTYYIYDFPGPRPNMKYGLAEAVMFMRSGHAVSTYMVVAVIAGTALYKMRAKLRWRFIRFPNLIMLGGLGITLKIASIIYGTFGAVVVRFLNPRRVAHVAVFMGLLACTYPIMRTLDVFPTDALVEFAERFEEERARSLNHRFVDENFVLDNLGDRWAFGWGHFGRIPGALTFSGDSGESGLDGFWNIQNGMAGIVGLELAMIFFLIPVLIGWRKLKWLDSYESQILVSAIMLCVGIRMADLLLNGWYNCIPVVLGGALAGALSRVKAPSLASRYNFRQTASEPLVDS